MEKLMKKKLILGGTSTTHNYIKTIKGDFIISVATEYGFENFKKLYPNNVVLKKFDSENLKKFIKDNNIYEIIDTTHPFAECISETAEKVAKELSIPYFSEIRKTNFKIDYKNAYTFDTYEEIILFLKEKKFQSIMFTIGANNISLFKDFAEYSYVRILPFEKSIKKCRDAGFQYENIIALQGPFSENLNMALIQEFNIDCMVTKNSGEGSGFQEKLNACKKKSIDIIIKNK
jgi:precorrin-6A/cobalt-precorrin-6A reductase